MQILCSQRRFAVGALLTNMALAVFIFFYISYRIKCLQLYQCTIYHINVVNSYK